MPNIYSTDFSSSAYRTDTLIIGAGQAGLAAAYYAQRAGLECILVDEQAAVGDVWNLRYDSLRLFSPAWASSLPGWPWPGNPLRYPTGKEAAEYLRAYAARFQFQIHHQQRVVRLQQVGNSGYRATTAMGQQYIARQVVVCTGGFQAPKVPALTQQLGSEVTQLHSRDYRQPSQVPGSGPVAVVGSGNSALQIAADLARAGRSVYLAFDERTPAMPNNALMWVMLKVGGLLRASRHRPIGAQMIARPEPVVSSDLRAVRRLPNVHLIGRAVTAPTPSSLQGQHHTTPALDAVLWATGYAPDFQWIELPVLDASGHPVHYRGLTQFPGLAFLGLPWLDSRGSALLEGVGRDARRVIRALAAGRMAPVEKMNVNVAVLR
ncbi:flavin-containing monooxygenase [Hymenobacter koreensis]|uniref:NAD(P)/FAD-dependent oxidoreductase n=1 Tax=Hymenobacter koreensis TaxID=1084523 RepID=A0ABP8JLJ5_9BACT